MTCAPIVGTVELLMLIPKACQGLVCATELPQLHHHTLGYQGWKEIGPRLIPLGDE